MSLSIPEIEIIGAGVAGLSCATLLAELGCTVTVRAASAGPNEQCCSWWAGGMLAPWCELENAEHLIAELGLQSMSFWTERISHVENRGSLVLASARDQPDLQQFAQRTKHFTTVDSSGIAELEPELAGRFEHGLFFESECHLDPRKALAELTDGLRRHPGVTMCFGREVNPAALAQPTSLDWRIDCRGLAARDQLSDLRGVRGEMLLLRLPELSLSRPVRLLHPRYPLYIVPREDNLYMVGATMLESDERGDTTVRSAMELLSAAFALHPSFAEAGIVEMGCDARPAFTDNLPQLRRRGKTIHINGLFRHGFLCGPALAQRVADYVMHNKLDERVMDENSD